MTDSRRRDATPAEEIYDYEVPTDPVERRKRIEEGMRESHEDLLKSLREHDAAMRELGKPKGIFERLFGFRTSV